MSDFKAPNSISLTSLPRPQLYLRGLLLRGGTERGGGRGRGNKGKGGRGEEEEGRKGGEPVKSVKPIRAHKV